nr:hypothetical protein [Bacillus sp. XF8]
MEGTPVSAIEEEHRTFQEAHEGVKKGFAGTFEQLAEHIERVK